MPQYYVRLAFVQMFFVILTIFFTGIAIKSRFDPLPATAFPVLVRDYGVLLLLIPVAWCVWSIWWSHRERFDSRDEIIPTSATGG